MLILNNHKRIIQVAIPGHGNELAVLYSFSFQILHKDICYWAHWTARGHPKLLFIEFPIKTEISVGEYW